LTCERGHSDWFVNEKGWCSFIIAYAMKKIGGTNALFCGDLPIYKKMPEEYLRIVGAEGEVN